MRKLVKLLAVAAVLLVAAMTSAAAPAPSSARGTHHFWYAISPGESFTTAVRHAAGASGGQVAATVKDMIQRVEAGKRVLVPEGTRAGVRMVPATVAGLRAALAASRAAHSRPGPLVARLRIPDPHDFKI